MRTPWKFERMPGFLEQMEVLGRSFGDHDGYFRENDGSWNITDCDGVRICTVPMQAKAKRGHGYETPDPEGQAIARLIVEAVNTKEQLAALTIDETSPWYKRDLLDTIANLKRQLGERDLATVIASWRYKFKNEIPWTDSDPIAEFQLLNDVSNEGFEMAHALRECGHSRGDFRDAGYIPGQLETYTASEKCVGCVSVALARRQDAEIAHNEKSGDNRVIEERILAQGTTALDACVQEKVDRAKAEAFDQCCRLLTAQGSDVCLAGAKVIDRWREDAANRAKVGGKS